jgi:ubiquinone/menaquinone biosynthesis C-methylase UbiE
MTDPTRKPSSERALSFGEVADTYDRARPSYPEEAAAWLVGSTTPAAVLELGAGTGKLTAQLAKCGHRVTATDPSEPMLRRLVARVPEAAAALATAEQIPVASRSVDVVVCAQAFHWFDVERTLPEVARVLRPGGALAVTWNLRDERIPWVKRLGALIGTPEQMADPTAAVDASELFGQVEKSTFRFWQPQTRGSLSDLVSSRSNIALMSVSERERVLRKVDALYDSYGRGADGMLLPYVTHCYRATVTHQAETDSRGSGMDDELDALLIDFS